MSGSLRGAVPGQLSQLELLEHLSDRHDHNVFPASSTAGGAMRRAAATLIVAVGTCVAGAVPAAAAAPVGTCAGPFTLLDRTGQIALAAQVRPSFTPEQVVAAVDAGLAAYDKNSDGRLCVQVHRHPTDEPFVNLIDNKRQGG